MNSIVDATNAANNAPRAAGGSRLMAMTVTGQ